jgi:hypothetical protein
MQEVELNLAFRWFCGLGLEDAVKARAWCWKP